MVINSGIGEDCFAASKEKALFITRFKPNITKNKVYSIVKGFGISSVAVLKARANATILSMSQ